MLSSVIIPDDRRFIFIFTTVHNKSGILKRNKMLNETLRKHIERRVIGDGSFVRIQTKQNSEKLKSRNIGTQKVSSKRSTTPETPHDKKIKDAKQHLGGAMDVILRMLEDSGVAIATINELRQDIRKQNHKEVLTRAQQYSSCFKSSSSAYFLLLNGWETLNRLHTLRFQQSLKIVRLIKLGEKKGNIRKANLNLQMLAEECAASQLGLYKAQAWKSRMGKGR